MKKAFALLSIVVLFGFEPVSAQSDAKPESFVFEEVDTASGTADQLFVKAAQWVATTYTTPTGTVQLSDKAAGKLILKGYHIVAMPKKGQWPVNMNVSYTLTVDVQDGRYRYRIGDFKADRASVGTPATFRLSDPTEKADKKYRQEVAHTKEEIRRHTDSLMKSLSSALHQSPDTF